MRRFCRSPVSSNREWMRKALSWLVDNEISQGRFWRCAGWAEVARGSVAPRREVHVDLDPPSLLSPECRARLMSRANCKRDAGQEASGGRVDLGGNAEQSRCARMAIRCRARPRSWRQMDVLRSPMGGRCAWTRSPPCMRHRGRAAVRRSRLLNGQPVGGLRGRSAPCVAPASWR